MGAAAGLETAAETPPIRKSIAKPFSEGTFPKLGDADHTIERS